MPVTPVHMGPGILIKALAPGVFSLMVFGYAQVLIDLQPLVALVSHRGVLHGWTHTLLGALAIGAFATATGRPLANLALRAFASRATPVRVSWWIAAGSAFVGTFSHVALDSLIYRDMHPFLPWSNAQPTLGLLTSAEVYGGCLAAGVVGTVLYVVRTWRAAGGRASR